MEPDSARIIGHDTIRGSHIYFSSERNNSLLVLLRVKMNFLFALSQGSCPCVESGCGLLVCTVFAAEIEEPSCRMKVCIAFPLDLDLVHNANVLWSNNF